MNQAAGNTRRNAYADSGRYRAMPRGVEEGLIMERQLGKRGENEKRKD